MALITDLEVRLSQQPSSVILDQPIYIPPRDIKIGLSGLSRPQLLELENILDKYAWVGLIPTLTKTRFPQYDTGISREVGAEPEKIQEWLHIYYCGKVVPFPFIGGKHTASLRANCYDGDAKIDGFNAGIELSLPGGKSCKVMTEIIAGITPDWSVAAKECYDALPDRCKAQMPLTFK